MVVGLQKTGEGVCKTGNGCLTFAFLNENHGDITFMGRMKCEPVSDENAAVKGCIGSISLWGDTIPIIDPMYNRGSTKISEDTCIVIFEYLGKSRDFLGIVVEEVANVMNIAGKNIDDNDDLRKQYVS